MTDSRPEVRNPKLRLDNLTGQRMCNSSKKDEKMLKGHKIQLGGAPTGPNGTI